MFHIVVVSACLWCIAATVSADTVLDPPVDKPSWWTHPPDGLTRLQYHSFKTDPDLTTTPDYVQNGYPPSVPDDWTITGVDLNQTVAKPQDPLYGDGVAALVEPTDTFKKLMGNQAAPLTKLWFVEIVWTTKSYVDLGILPLNFPYLDVAATGSSVQGDGGGILNTTRHGDWWVTTWSGTIIPQPNQETFTFSFVEATYVDSAWIGTHCVPTPAAGIGALGLMTAYVAVRSLRRR
jgi:hypothetical protein